MYHENSVTLIGFLGKDPEVRTFGDGGKIANLRLATTRKWKNRAGEVQEETEWHSVAVTADGLVGIVEKYARKGSYLRVIGRLRTRKWQDQSGQDRYSTEIVVGGYDGKIGLLDRQNGSGSGSGGYQGDSGPGSSGPSSPPPDQGFDDEIPF